VAAIRPILRPAVASIPSPVWLPILMWIYQSVAPMVMPPQEPSSRKGSGAVGPTPPPPLPVTDDSASSPGPFPAPCPLLRGQRGHIESRPSRKGASVVVVAVCFPMTPQSTRTQPLIWAIFLSALSNSRCGTPIFGRFWASNRAFKTHCETSS